MVWAVLGRLLITQKIGIYLVKDGFDAYLLPNAAHKRVSLLTLLLSSTQVGTSKQCIATHDDDWRQHRGPRMTIRNIKMMTTPVTTPVCQRPYQLTQLLTSARCVSWHRVIHASRWCRAVINASVSRVPTKCTTKDTAVLFATRLSTCCCVCTNLTCAWSCVWK